MFKCVNLRYTFKDDWAFRIGIRYELEEENIVSYTFKVKDDEGQEFYFNAPKECFEEVKNIIGYKLVKPEYESAVSAIVEFKFNPLILTGCCHFENNSITKHRLEKAGVLDLWCEPVYEEAVKVPKVDCFELEIKGDKMHFGEYCIPVNWLDTVNNRKLKYIHLDDNFFITDLEMNEIREYLKTI